MACTWYADDYATESGPSDFQSFGSFAAALASTANFTIPNLVWGSISAYFAADGSAPFVEIVFSSDNQTWTWIVGANGPFPALSYQGGGFTTAQLALAAMQQSGNQPTGFCTVFGPVMDCSPQSLIALAQCADECVSAGLMGASQIASACAWANAGGGPPCTLPSPPIDLGASAGNGQVTLSWPDGTGATGYNIKRALVPGGPYTVIGTSAASPYVDLTAANGTTYYYVVSSTNACGESAGNSIESHATPLAPFSYAPATSIITWTDMNGAGLNGNLAFFNAHANFGSVTSVNISSQGITSVSSLAALPALTYLNLENNTIAVLDVTGCVALTDLYCTNNMLTSLDVSNNLSLTVLSCPLNQLTTLDASGLSALTQLLCYSNALTTVNVTGCSALNFLHVAINQLTTVDISTNPLLTTFYVFSNVLTVLAVNTILTNLVSAGLTGGTVHTGIQTPAAPPSVGPPNGIVAKAALLAEVPAWSVTTD